MPTPAATTRSSRSGRGASTAKKATSAGKKATSTAKKATSTTAKQATSTARKATSSTAKKATSAARKATSPARQVAKKATGGTAASKRTARKSSSNPDVIAVLKADHRDVEALFKRFEGLGDTAHKSREATVGKIIEMLSQHASVEEEIVYPDARRRLEDDDTVLEALEEHHVVKWTLSELEKMRSTDERYTAKVTVLMESVRHHVKEEEDEFFPELRKAATPSELRELGDAVREAKKSAPTRPHPRSPDEPPGNIITNALAAPMDATARLVGSAADRVRGLS